MSSYTLLDNINIKDWQTFLDNNEEIERALDRCCSNVADMIANSNSLSTVVPTINSELGKLKKVSVSSIPEPTDLFNETNALNTYLQEKSIKVVCGLSYAELMIDAYNKGEEVDPEVTDAFSKIMKGLADSNVYWLVYELTKGKGLEALGFTLAYGNDAGFEGGNFVVGDGFWALFGKNLTSVVKADIPPYWINACTGAIVVAGFSMIKDWLTDEGKWDSKDTERLFANAGAAGLAYAEWTIIAGAIGGPLGIIVAGLAAIPTSILLGDVADWLVGDNIIDEFTLIDENGVEHTYKVPKNGNGKDGTWDVMLERFNRNINNRYLINGEPVSARYYNDLLYSDWEKLVLDDTGIVPGDWTSPYWANEEFNGALQAMLEYDNFDDALEAFWEYADNTMYSCDVDILLSELASNYGFRLEEWYNINHGGE